MAKMHKNGQHCVQMTHSKYLPKHQKCVRMAKASKCVRMAKASKCVRMAQLRRNGQHCVLMTQYCVEWITN